MAQWLIYTIFVDLDNSEYLNLTSAAKDLKDHDTV